VSDIKFTPGPWTKCGCGHCELVWAADGETTIHTSPDNEETRTAEGEESQANARLISAAPDMYAVLKDLEESVDYWSEYDVPIGIVDRIKVALAKAEGRTE